MTGSPRRQDANKSLLALLLAVTLVALTACGPTGSGNIITETRDVGSFTRIRASDGITVELTVDPALSQSVSVTFDDNLLADVVTRVVDDVLEVKLQGSMFQSVEDGRFVAVITDGIERIKVSGGSDVTGDGVIDSYRLEVSGGSDVDLRDLRASSVEIDVSGGSDVQVFASDSITGKASGGSDVEVFGRPVSNVDESGDADVTVRVGG